MRLGSYLSKSCSVAKPKRGEFGDKLRIDYIWEAERLLLV